jgi:uncharacterized protein GlcG (DUF336 family)
MKLQFISALLLAAASLSAESGLAADQTPPANPMDVVPDKTPFSTPYGAPIPLQRAQSLIQAATAEAAKRGWAMDVAVVDPGAYLVAFAHMDGAQLGSIAIAEHKARTSAKFRRPTRVFEDGLLKSDYKYILSLDDVIAVRGGIPLIENGKLIGAIGCSGGTASQDEVICTGAAALINK